MLINIRGTSGSGKSTLTRSIMGLYAQRFDVTGAELGVLQDRKRPLGYSLHRGTELPVVRPLFVPGHYETACGGCDTIATEQFTNVFRLVRRYAADGFDVLFEGLLLSAESRRMIELHREFPSELHVIGLTTPLEECLAGIKDRRDTKGGSKAGQPFADSVLKNATSKFKGTEGTLKKMEAAGVPVYRLDRTQALAKAKELLAL